jgi:hypothetical protein
LGGRKVSRKGTLELEPELISRWVDVPGWAGAGGDYLILFLLPFYFGAYLLPFSLTSFKQE